MQGHSHRFEVAVVGGGPAGSAAAIVLARQGHRVLLLERRRFPRFHVGESLLPESNALLERLGVSEQVRSEGFVVKRGASFVTESGDVESHIDFADSPEVEAPATWQVPRARFDELLLREAEAKGVEVVEGARVQRFELDDEGVELTVSRGGRTMSHRMGLLIDASGQAGLVARRLQLRRVDRELRNVAVHAWFEGVERPAGVRSGDIRIVSLHDLGWVWLIPIDDRVTSVGLVTPRAQAPPEGELEARLEKIPALRPVLAAAHRVSELRRDADFSYYPSRYAGFGWFLAGDAGSFVDPVFSSGVFLALQSGVEAGEAAADALEGVEGAFDAFDRVQRRRYRFFRRFAKSFYDPAFRDLFFAPQDRWGMRLAVVAALAGVWRPSIATQLRLELFFACVLLQRRFTIAPRLHQIDV